MRPAPMRPAPMRPAPMRPASMRPALMRPSPPPRRYVSDLAGVKRYGAALHLSEAPPDLLVVDDLAELINATRCV
jgi:hypothetical protein